MITRVTGATVAPTLPLVDFDATYGYALDDLLACGAPGNEPADFDEFWAGVRAEALAVDPDPEVGPWEPTGPDGVLVARVAVTALDGARLTGWLARSAGELQRALVIGHGYGGRTEPKLVLPEGCLSIQLVSRGQPGSEQPGMPSDPYEHVLFGIDSPRSYTHTGAAADQWAATTVVAGLAPGVPIGYEGGSFGGGIGVLAAAYEDRFDAVQVTVPSFGNHPLRITLPCTGSGKSIQAHAVDHPDVVDVLRYVDSATAASRVQVPVLCVTALADPGVPPPGQFAVATSFAGPTWLHVQPGGHSEWESQVEDLAESARQVAEFWADPAGAVAGEVLDRVSSRPVLDLPPAEEVLRRERSG